MSEWECIVVGAGIVGSWTAYHLAAAGKRTLMLDQYMLPHNRGSSSGQTRIIRKAYNKDFYAEMMPEAYDWWNKLEKKAGVQLYRNTGMLIIQHKDATGVIEETQSAMDKYNLEYKLLAPGEMSEKYPHITYNDQYKGLLDINGGLLLNSRCLNAVQDDFKKNGGKIQDGEKVLEIVPGSPVKVITSVGTYTTRKLVIAAGPWSKDVLSQTGVDLSVKTMPGLSVFFKERDAENPCYSVEQNNFPIAYNYLYNKPGNYRFVATFPSLEYPGMVKMVTRGEPPPYYCHPDERDTRGSQDLVDILVKYVKEHLPGLDPRPRIMEPCVYTMSPDKDYIIDLHPKCDNIVIAAGFSGHGYKLSPVTGKILCQLAQGKPTSYAIKQLSLARFKQAKL